MNAPHIWTAEQLLAFTHHADDDLRTWAWDRLVLHHPEEASRHAARGLADPAWFVVAHALDALAKNPQAEANEALEALLERTNTPKGLRNQALRRLRGEPEPEPIEDLEDAEVAHLIAHPDELRRRAPELLSGSSDERETALLALADQPFRWATELILDRLDGLLSTNVYEQVWDELLTLGDPRALPAALAAWKPGERRIAALAVRLDTLAPSGSALPEGLVRDAEAQARSAASAIEGLLQEEDTRAGERELRLDLRCASCRKTGEYSVGSAVMHPEIERCKAEGWDGIVLGRIIVCKYCGVEDSYELTTSAMFKITGSLMALAAQKGKQDPDNPVSVAELGLWDGSICKRPSQALRHLRELAEREPTRGEGWRRLGNLYERYDREEQAVEAWMRATADETEMEACYSLAKHHAEAGHAQQAFAFAAKTIARIRGMDKSQPADMRRGAADFTLDLLREMLEFTKEPIALTVVWHTSAKGSKSVVANVSSVDLRTVRRWDRLVDLFASDSFIHASLTSELPEERSTILDRLLESDLPFDASLQGGSFINVGPRTPAAPLRSGPKTGRNDPCPCGSGKKFKKCCGR